MKKEINFGISTFAVFTITLFAIFNLAISVTAQNNLDPNYNAGVTESYNSIFASVVQPDGKIIIAGRFQKVNGANRVGIERLNADGTRDTSFNAGGSGLDYFGYYVALQPDGKILVGGNFYQYNGQSIPQNIIRLNADGSLDKSFNSGGTGANSLLLDTVIQPDGKILIAGYFTQYNGVSRNRIARLNADGSLDTSFDPGSGANNGIEEIELQADGKIIIGGYFSAFNGESRNAFARLNADGSLDSTFDIGTGATIDNDTTTGQILGIGIQSDGKIVIGGSFNRINGVTKFGLARLNADGSLDTGFINPSSYYVDYIIAQPNGKILIGGGLDYPNSYGVLRLNSNGSHDTSFQPTRVNDAVNHIAVQTDGKLLVGGNFTTWGNTERRNFVRINGDGTLDTSFNPVLERVGVVNKIFQQDDGKTVVAGDFLLANGVRRSNIARFNSDGTVDPTFVPITTPSYQGIQAVAVQPNGKILIGGTFTGTDTVPAIPLNRLARLNADGSLDQTFTPAVTVLAVRALQIQPDGKILVGGVFRLADNTSRGLVRLNADGSLDETFNTGSGANSQVLDVEIQPDGKILIGGFFSQYNGTARGRIARLNADGSLDASFADGAGANGSIYDLAVQSDGKIVAVGSFNTFNGVSRGRIVRLNADGSLDTSFDPGSGANSLVTNVEILPNGKLFIAGYFDSYNNFSTKYLAQIKADGSVDTSFASGFADNPAIQINDLAVQPDGKVLVGGIFTSYGGTARNSLLRIAPVSNRNRPPFDFDGDGKTDYVVFRPTNGVWYQLNSTSGFTGAQFGLSTDQLAPADFDGDGKTDIAVFRNGIWFLLQSSAGFAQTQFGQAGDVPIPADFDGDGKADLAVYRDGANGGQSFFYYLGSLNNPSKNITFIPFGSGGDKPVVGDYDGDGKTDPAVYRNGVWYLLRSQAGATAVQFGIATDKATPADFDGDGKTDLAVYRKGVWYVLNSSDSKVQIVQFGLETDVPTVGDYDGDGKADFSVWRESNGVFYVLGSRAGFTAVQFGTSGDVPVASAYVP